MEHRIQTGCVLALRDHIPNGGRTPWVARPQAAFVSIREGAVETEFGTGSGLSPMMRESGSVVCFPAHLRRRSRALSPIGMSYTAALLTFELFSGVDLLGFMNVPMLFPRQVGTQVAPVLEELADLSDRDHDSFRDVARHQELCLRLLGLVLDVAPMQGDAVWRLSGLPRLQPVLEYLDRNFAGPLRVEHLATIAGLSQGQFHRCFKALTGTSPFEYAKRLRLQMAATLLRESDLTVAEIGSQVGWPDPFHFSKMFKSSYAQSPTGYRRSGPALP